MPCCHLSTHLFLGYFIYTHSFFLTSTEDDDVMEVIAFRRQVRLLGLIFI